ncbi:MAG: NAD(P)-dependent alcohol dehydrogenase [Prolixibacteraceae bacterium]|jgi:NADPH:quinone reductase-like Zn-dependent oxidoreductase|nr:NAD(P)-dependent alcohol dehydrogenase [Prolixibacteraceae bacterium]
MKAIVYREYGTPDVLKLEEIEKPVPKDNEVLIKVKASSINSWDYDMLTGRPKLYQLLSGIGKPRYPVLGADVAGVVEAIGSKVKSFQLGDEVFGDLSNSGWGAFAEYVCAKETSLAIKPKGLSFINAAALPQGGVMAWQGIFEKVELKKGSKVLINGAGGSLGTLALQLAKQIGAIVTCVDSSSKLEALTKLGADVVLDYRLFDYTNTGERYDLVLDLVANKSLKAYRKTLTENGVFAMVGGKIKSIFQAMIFGNKRLGILAHQPNKYLKELANACVKGELKPIIDSTFSLDNTAEAFHYFAKGDFVGKIIIYTKDK